MNEQIFNEKGDSLSTCFHGLNVANISLDDVKADIKQVRSDIKVLEECYHGESKHWRQLEREEIKKILADKKSYLSGLLELKAFKLTQKNKVEMDQEDH
jgi:hypothetical protein